MTRVMRLLAGMRWPEVEPAVVLVPVGSLEQHGPALGLGTDALVASHVTRRAACVLSGLSGSPDGEHDFVVAPTVPYGASGEHEDFPGTISIGLDALHHLLVELGRSACRWARGVVLVNGHGGNVASLVSAVCQLREEGRAVAWTSCRARDIDAHAGRAETSLMLALAAGPGLHRPGPQPDAAPAQRRGARGVSVRGARRPHDGDSAGRQTDPRRDGGPPGG